MAIDDPFAKEVSLAREDVEEEEYLPNRLLWMAGSATIAAALVQMPLVAQPLISLISSRSKRFEERFIRMMEEMNEQLKRNGENPRSLLLRFGRVSDADRSPVVLSAPRRGPQNTSAQENQFQITGQDH